MTNATMSAFAGRSLDHGRMVGSNGLLPEMRFRQIYLGEINDGATAFTAALRHRTLLQRNNAFTIHDSEHTS